MTASEDNPTYVYKLVPHTSPVPPGDGAALPDVLPVSDIDRKSGFVHLSTSRQILGTLIHFFTTDPRVFVLRIPYDPLQRRGLIKWEDPEGAVCGPRPGEGLFPHLYNDLKLGREEVESVAELERGDGGWEEAIGRVKAWLVY